MVGKALNKANLLTLGADVLADLLLETVKGDAARQRRVRMALAAEQGVNRGKDPAKQNSDQDKVRPLGAHFICWFWFVNQKT